MPNENKVQLKLEAIVEYELNGVPIVVPTRWLGKLPFDAFDEGTLTMDTEATCTVVSSEVSQVDQSAPLVRDMEPADYLRKGIWAMNDLIRIYPDGPFKAIRDGLSDRLSNEMSKGPQETKGPNV